MGKHSASLCVVIPLVGFKERHLVHFRIKSGNINIISVQNNFTSYFDVLLDLFSNTINYRK